MTLTATVRQAGRRKEEAREKCRVNANKVEEEAA